jgi:hypothetical protein
VGPHSSPLALREPLGEQVHACTAFEDHRCAPVDLKNVPGFLLLNR